jgi:hypothetical protein
LSQRPGVSNLKSFGGSRTADRYSGSNANALNYVTYAVAAALRRHSQCRDNLRYGIASKMGRIRSALGNNQNGLWGMFGRVAAQPAPHGVIIHP